MIVGPRLGEIKFELTVGGYSSTIGGRGAQGPLGIKLVPTTRAQNEISTSITVLVFSQNPYFFRLI